MTYIDLLDTIFMALVDVGRNELRGSDASALAQYKNCREVREENNKGALILAYNGDDLCVLQECGFIRKEPEILDRTYSRKDLAGLVGGQDDDCALLIDSCGTVAWVEEICNYPPKMSDVDIYKFMPPEILCLNKRTKAGSRTKAAARASVAGCGDIHAFVKKQSGPNPKMVVEFGEHGTLRQAYAGLGPVDEIAFYIQEFEPGKTGWSTAEPRLLCEPYSPNKVAAKVPIGAVQKVTYTTGLGPDMLPQVAQAGAPDNPLKQ